MKDVTRYNHPTCTHQNYHHEAKICPDCLMTPKDRILGHESNSLTQIVRRLTMDKIQYRSVHRHLA